MFEKSPKYQVRIVRFWAESSLDEQKMAKWRFSLENPETAERRSATDLESLLVLLRADIEQVFSEAPKISFEDSEGNE